MVVCARRTIKTIIDVPLRVNHPALPEPVPALFGPIKIVCRPALRPRRQMRRNVNVKLVRNGVDVSVLLVPPQAATWSRAVSLIHVVEDRLGSSEVVLLASYVVYGDPGLLDRCLIESRLGKDLPSQCPPPFIIVVVVQEPVCLTCLRHLNILRDRWRSGVVVRARKIFCLDDLLHLQVVFLSLGESVLPDTGAFILDRRIDRSQICDYGKTFMVAGQYM